MTKKEEVVITKAQIDNGIDLLKQIRKIADRKQSDIIIAEEKRLSCELWAIKDSDNAYMSCIAQTREMAIYRNTYDPYISSTILLNQETKDKLDEKWRRMVEIGYRAVQINITEF